MTSQPSIKFVNPQYLLWKYDYNSNKSKKGVRGAGRGGRCNQGLSADGCRLWSLMKSCSPAEPPNYLYRKPSQPMGLEEKKAAVTALPSQSAEASQPSRKNIKQQPFLSDLPGGRKFYR